MAKDDVTEVELGDWKRRGRGAVLATQHVSVGAVVGFSNLVTGNGYLGFFTLDYLKGLQALVKAVLKEEGAPGRVRLWYGGAALLPTRHPNAYCVNPETMRLRIAVGAALDRHPFARIYSQWLPPNKELGMTLHCGTRNCAIRVVDAPAPI